MQGMRIPALANLIAACWTGAEQALREAIKQEYPDRDEEMVTELFQGKLKTQFDLASSNRNVERAFLSDLHRTLPLVPDSDLSNIARGLVATVQFHPREVERKSGGDFGIVLVRPDVRYARYTESELTINKDYQRGLLCQAKIFRRDSSWGALTSSQRKVLRDRLNYLALVLYRYADQTGECRCELSPFQWQLTRDVTIDNINGWLAADEFPKLEDSQQIINALSRDIIGTDDKDVIIKYIAPPTRTSLSIKIQWRDGDGPGDTVRLHNASANQIQQVVIQRGGEVLFEASSHQHDCFRPAP